MNPHSPFLSERLISRLSPMRRANLERTMVEHAEYAENGCNARGDRVTDDATSFLGMRLSMLGRLSAITA